MIRLAAIGSLTAAALSSAVFWMPSVLTVSYEKIEEASGIAQNLTESTPVFDDREEVSHVPLPKQVKAIYMTACVTGTKDFRERLVKLVEETEVNSLIIDIKDYSGTISFPPHSEEWRPAWVAAKCGTADMKDFIAALHEKGIFVIGRITVFQDPYYTSIRPDLAVKKADKTSVWKDHKGLSFIDVGAREYWDHVVTLSRDSYNIGFDELNFDYVRYPSDGPMNDIAFVHSKDYPNDNNKQANLEEFFRYLKEKLSDEDLYKDFKHTNTGRKEVGPWTSADLFGMTTTNYDDLSIGQVQDRAAPYFDFIVPMVYPSHYPKNSFGYANPNDYPYEIVNYAMKRGVERMRATATPMMGFLHTRIGTSTPAVYQKPAFGADKLRTWIQDFDYGGDYDIEEVREQIQASYDAGVMSWMIWAPSNIYTRGALKDSDTIE